MKTDGDPPSGRDGCEQNQLVDQREKQGSSESLPQGGAPELCGKDRQGSST